MVIEERLSGSRTRFAVYLLYFAWTWTGLRHVICVSLLDSDSLQLTDIHMIAGQAHGLVLLMVTALACGGMATSLFVMFMFSVDRPATQGFFRVLFVCGLSVSRMYAHWQGLTRNNIVCSSCSELSNFRLFFAFTPCMHVGPRTFYVRPETLYAVHPRFLSM
ncbi:hypothetical protein C8Q74DRAFT_902166 [Fomes fomentarius]|nr:hypothetical protein C8Q74DRAFT_902166 [Fomes fomentarius]